MKFHIDGSNIGRLAKQKDEVISLEVVLSLCHHILSEGDDFLCHFDANARYLLEEDKKPIFEQLLISERFKSAPPKNRADQYILDDATDDLLNGVEVKIISNDLYRDFLDPKDPRYKPEYSQYSWVDPLKGTHHTGSISRGKNGQTLKILSLNFKIPIEEDVSKLLPLLIPEIIEQKSRLKSDPIESNTITNKDEDKNKTTSNKNTELYPPKVKNISSPRPDYNYEQRQSNDPNEAIKLVAKILGPIIFLVILISYTSGNKNEINTSNPTPVQESRPEYNLPSYNHIEENTSSSNEAEPKQENIPNREPAKCSNCGGSGKIITQQTHPCGSCSGTGKKTCYTCSPVPCPNCKASGRFICANCSGNGYKLCGNCEYSG